MGLTGMGFSTVAIAAGAIMYWAVTYQGHGFRFSTVGGHPHGRRGHRPCDLDDRLRHVTSSRGRPSACVRQADHRCCRSFDRGTRICQVARAVEQYGAECLLRAEPYPALA
jgi:hypothetical protein